MANSLRTYSKEEEKRLSSLMLWATLAIIRLDEKFSPGGLDNAAESHEKVTRLAEGYTNPKQGNSNWLFLSPNDRECFVGEIECIAQCEGVYNFETEYLIHVIRLFNSQVVKVGWRQKPTLEEFAKSVRHDRKFRPLWRELSGGHNREDARLAIRRFSLDAARQGLEDMDRWEEFERHHYWLQKLIKVLVARLEEYFEIPRLIFETGIEEMSDPENPELIVTEADGELLSEMLAEETYRGLLKFIKTRGDLQPYREILGVDVGNEMADLLSDHYRGLNKNFLQHISDNCKDLVYSLHSIIATDEVVEKLWGDFLTDIVGFFSFSSPALSHLRAVPVIFGAFGDVLPGPDPSKVSIRKVSKAVPWKPGMECPVCLGKEDIMAQLQCGHIFCKTCLRLQFHSLMPNRYRCCNCRASIFSGLVEE